MTLVSDCNVDRFVFVCAVSLFGGGRFVKSPSQFSTVCTNFEISVFLVDAVDLDDFLAGELVTDAVPTAA